jgi:RND family efflux transporter MFP subunit
MPVEVVTLAERPVEQTTEFVGIVKSRRSATVQPQVEGFVTRILVRSGARVAPGAALLEIDPRMQEAAVSSLESLLAVRKADLQQARQQATRMKTLLEAGAASQAEMEQAETALATTEAQAKAIEAQLREQRVALAYHTVSAPTAGIVGDIPVRVGDRVTKSTLLTTIDESAGLEIYVNVPVQEAANLRVGLPVRLVDDSGSVLATERLSYVSASVESATQSVLAATCGSARGCGPSRSSARGSSGARRRRSPSRSSRSTAPAASSSPSWPRPARRATVARQRAVEPGVVGNDYVVKSGLKPGDRLIVSGVQKIGDGAPVTILTAKATESPAPQATPGGKGD